MGPDDFANLAARALEPKLPDIISVAHIHAARVSVREQAAIIVERLRRVGQASFRTLTRDCDTTLLVVARFLALLEIYRDGLVTFDQPTPLGELYVRDGSGMTILMQIRCERLMSSIPLKCKILEPN
jgi:segregation and condensation protein A